MAFNVSNYVKDADKPYTNRIADPIINSATYGLPTSAATIAASTTEQLLNTGMSSTTAADLVASRTDNAINGGADEFYVLSGKDPTRAARVSLQSLRRKATDTKDFLNNTNPATKIAAYRGDNSVEIITVL
jgi:hypothetical protein